MSDDANARKVDSELADRLDSLFADDDVESARAGGEASDPLDELKSLVMSIEWEITDDLMERFVGQVEILKKRYQDDRILVMFLQLLGSLGLYIKSNKGKAHPSAFGLLSSVYASFATAALPDQLSSSEKKKRLYVELNKYKELKEQVGGLRGANSEPPPRSKQSSVEPKAVKQTTTDQDSREVPGPECGTDAPPAGITLQQFEAAIQDMRQMIRDEFKQLRAALALERRHSEEGPREGGP